MVFVCSYFASDNVQDGLQHILKKENRKALVDSSVLLIIYEDICGNEYKDLYEYKCLLKCNFKSITIFDLNKDDSIPDGNFDIIFVPGGNTFTLLSKIRAKSLDNYITNFIANKGLYIGESAGAHIVYSDIEHILGFDDNNVGLEDFSALNIIKNSILVCHFEDEKIDYLCKLWLKTKEPNFEKYDTVYSLRNNEYLYSTAGENMDLCDACEYLEHIFIPPDCPYNLTDLIEVEVVRVNPNTMKIDKNKWANSLTQVWLESGPAEYSDEENEWVKLYDHRLDCSGDTFEQAIFNLVELVKKHYFYY